MKKASVKKAPVKKAAVKKAALDSKVKSAKKKWELRLYVAGQTEKSVLALQNLKKICEEHLRGEYSIEVVDLFRSPQLAKGDQIIATPTLVKKLPNPVKRIIGDLSDTERVLVGLNLRSLQKVKSSKISKRMPFAGKTRTSRD